QPRQIQCPGPRPRRILAAWAEWSSGQREERPRYAPRALRVLRRRFDCGDFVLTFVGREVFLWSQLQCEILGLSDRFSLDGQRLPRISGPSHLYVVLHDWLLLSI